MSVEEYRAAGYDMSANMESAKVARAEYLCTLAYIRPILGDEVDATEPNVGYRECLMSLAYLYLLRNNAKLTRAGAKVKITDVSQVATEWDVIAQQNTECAILLQDLCSRATSAGIAANMDSITDINKIFFKSNYFYT